MSGTRILATMTIGRVSVMSENGRDRVPHAYIDDLSRAGGIWPTSGTGGTGGAGRADGAGGAGSGTWWHAYRDVVPRWFETYLEVEPSASLVRVYEPEYVPGLLQTEDYARATIAAWHGGDPPERIERRVELRMLRQRIVYRRPDPLRLWAVVDERALRADVCDAATMRGQIEHLLKMSAAPYVTLQVRPATADAAPDPVCLLRVPDRAQPDVIYLERPADALYPDEPGVIRHYLTVLNGLMDEAPPPEASAGILHRLLDTL
ncbi:hypothetical protein Acsp03_26800 [Actinomadura sp. NBRC 104412]|nr:hypothetical protein Acsp03_26800 [Actinomadura sp. NBRC 104412]